jgi:hypothetical protein
MAEQTKEINRYAKREKKAKKAKILKTVLRKKYS